MFMFRLKALALPDGAVTGRGAVMARAGDGNAVADVLFGEVHYSEGLQVGYRWYDANKVTPLLPFGYGLSCRCAGRSL
jgi:hypothetical protein